MNIEESRIPVPWGHLAVKAWGNKKNVPVLALHGIYDNAGTFDRLIPFLPSTFYYICIDLPSHGKSSRYPPHAFISSTNSVVALKLVVDYLNRKKFIFMGHSWGGQHAMFFAQLYPQYVLKLILLEAMCFLPVHVDDFKHYFRNKIDTLIKINRNTVPKKQSTYTYEEAIKKLIENRMFGGLTDESAEALLKRRLIPTKDGKVYLSTDHRLKANIDVLFCIDYTVNFMKKCPITCPTIIIHASASSEIRKSLKPCEEELRKQNTFRAIVVPGSHDVHNTNPEIVGPIVCKFLTETESKL